MGNPRREPSGPFSPKPVDFPPKLGGLVSVAHGAGTLELPDTKRGPQIRPVIESAVQLECPAKLRSATSRCSLHSRVMQDGTRPAAPGGARSIRFAVQRRAVDVSVEAESRC